MRTEITSKKDCILDGLKFLNSALEVTYGLISK
jgi:hypothetical protein